jgi:hypothetical protein
MSFVATSAPARPSASAARVNVLSPLADTAALPRGFSRAEDSK